MALFNKFFSFSKANDKNNESINEKNLAFNKEQIRVVLFRECDFRGRKLLFDSTAVEVIPIENVKPNCFNNESRSFLEVHNGLGYKYTKPQTDSAHLADMIFGLVAMSYRGSYFKIHNLDSPHRLMFTQVFPSPKTNSSKSAGSSHSFMSSQSLEYSLKLDDSGTSSINSISDQLSVHSTASDTVLVCRKKQSLPFSVKFSGSNKSDSGFEVHPPIGCNNNLSNYIKGTTDISFSNSTIYKRSLRSSSTSLEQSMSSMGSIDDSFGRPNLRSGKLGLAFIIELTKNQEHAQFQFLMEHIALIESMLCRARQATQFAYTRPNSFLLLLSKMVDFSAERLLNLLSGPMLPSNVWLSISSGGFFCDKTSISAFKNKTDETLFASISIDRSDLTKSCNLLSNNNESDGEFIFSNITRFLKWDSINIKRSSKQTAAERFIVEFCELLETVDVKDTNFFISTLLTAILTHHLGWVSTCLPVEDVSFPNVPFNPLWGQLSDLYGSVGYPIKMAQTILTGANRKDLIPKIVNSLTYFIRCSNIERQFFTRVNIEDDNKIVENICRKNTCLPKENYKKYKDHLKEMMEEKRNINIAKLKEQEINHTAIKLKRINTPVSLTAKSYLNLPKTESTVEMGPLKHTKKLTKISNCDNLSELGKSIQDEPSWEDKENESTGKNVIFLLGDEDKLVDIKKSNQPFRIHKKSESTTNILESIFKKYERFEQEFLQSPFRDEDFIKCETEASLKPSSSWANLPQLEDPPTPKVKTINKFIRAQSVPPEEREKEVKEEVKSKYKYNGMRFNLHQYPQVVTNYMRSKNLEMANFPLIGLTKKFDQISYETNEINLNFSRYDLNNDEMEAFQTPSNASELEFTSDLAMNIPGPCKAEIIKTTSKFSRETLENTIIKEPNKKKDGKMKIIEFPMPQSTPPTKVEIFSFPRSLIKSCNDCYIPDLVLQGTKSPKSEWESKLKRNLAVSTRQSLLDIQIDEAVAIIGDTDTWEVQLMSSHTYVIDKGSSGIKVGMSQLVSNMLDSLLKMWKLQVPAQYCLLHIEQRLQELCIRSKALAQHLLATEFCNMELLTSTLHLETNDVPLLLAVASTYSPQVTQKYGISFQ